MTVAETKVAEYQNKYYAEKQKCQNTHERALRYLKEFNLLQIKFRRAEAEVRRLKNLSEIYDCNGKRWEDRADSAVQRAEEAEVDKAKLVEALEKSRQALQGAKMLTQGPSFERQDAIMCHILEAITTVSAVLKEVE